LLPACDPLGLPDLPQGSLLRLMLDRGTGGGDPPSRRAPEAADAGVQAEAQRNRHRRRNGFLNLGTGQSAKSFRVSR
jgi:hypothetical protein